MAERKLQSTESLSHPPTPYIANHTRLEAKI